MVRADTFTFQISVDDQAKLYINDALVVYALCCSSSTTTSSAVTLPAGYHKFVMTFIEFGGGAGLRLRMSNSSAPTTFGSLPWHRVTPMAPGAPLPVDLRVNGVPATPACAAATNDLKLAGQAAVDYEAASVSTSTGQCPYFYSVYRTPTLFSSTLGTATPSGIVPVDYTRVADRYTLTVSVCAAE